jgi:Transcriptional regulators
MGDTRSVSSAEALVGLFRRVSKGMVRVRHQRGQEHHAQGHVLDIIREKDSISQKELLDLLGVRSASLSEVLAKLERNGCVSRMRDEHDRRGFIVSLTAKGFGEAVKYADERRRGAEALFASLSESERRQLALLLGTLASALDGEEPGSETVQGEDRSAEVGLRGKWREEHPRGFFSRGRMRS